MKYYFIFPIRVINITFKLIQINYKGVIKKFALYILIFSVSHYAQSEENFFGCFFFLEVVGAKWGRQQRE